MKYLPVIGLEIHIQLNTKSKMFCGCSANVWKAKPNSHVCPVCLGLPGALPVPNREAIKKAQLLGIALNCALNLRSKFDRKNYFYPDLPKGYQISQYDKPLCYGGYVKVGGKKVRIRRVHLEEDTAKSIHTKGVTLLDFNKAGIPLVEVVTEPDIENVEDAVWISKKIREISRKIGISEGDMEKGNIRFEANISLRKEDEKDIPNYRVEIKNINSFKFLGNALSYEVRRQRKELSAGAGLVQETRGWNERLKKTFTQRKKEFEYDYRYFPEPDIPPLVFTPSYVQKLKGSLPKLPDQVVEEVKLEYGLSEAAVRILTSNDKLLKLYRDVVSKGLNKDIAANLLVNRRKLREMSSSDLIKFYRKESSKISRKEELVEIVKDVILENKKAVSDFKAGKKSALQFLIGQIMGKTKGKADAKVVRKILEEELK